MAAVTRQPFAPLDGARLQSLTSLKNRQNALTPSGASGKRKAELLDADDFENVDPTLSVKRAKGASPAALSNDALKKPSAFLLARPASTPRHDVRPLSSPIKPASTSRRLSQQKSSGARPGSGVTKSSPMSAPAGRSPTRGRRSGILSSRRRTAGPCSRLAPPPFCLGSSAPFTLNAALKGTIAGYSAARPKDAVRGSTASRDSLQALAEPEMKASWFFDIHEDTPEQEMTNLLQHGTCVLDISSDEENERKARRDSAEGRDKENIPPSDDVSQTTSAHGSRRPATDYMMVEKERVALAEMNAADFFPEGCDESSIVIVPGDEEGPSSAGVSELAPAPAPREAEAEAGAGPELEADPVESVALLMRAPSDGSSSKAAVLQPMEGTGESFELWESGSTKDESEAVADATTAGSS